MNGLLSDGFVLFLFSQSANLGNADGGKQDQIRRKREAEKIDDRAEGEWHDLLNIGVHEQVRRLVRADVEHIEAFLQTASVGDFVKDHGDSHHAGENGHSFKNRLMLKLDVTAVEQIDGNRDHRAVANGGLDIDTDRIGINIVGNAHRDQSRKHGVGRKIRAERVVNLALSDQACQQTDVHRRGAELERERIPLIIKRRTASERKVDLLVNFQKRDDDRNGQHDLSDAVGLVLSVKNAKQNGGRDGHSPEKQVKPSPCFRTLHLRIEHPKHFFKKTHGVFSFFKFFS